MSESQFRRMRRIIAEQFPTLTQRQITYACNKISQAIRKWKGDCYGVTLSKDGTTWHGGDVGCYQHPFQVQVGGHLIHGQIAID